jgi:hypothetical protein
LEALKGLGRFQEALSFDEKALAEVQRCADSGDTASQDEVWVYHVNRGRLYLRLGRIDEAEQLLREALPSYIPGLRRTYRMFADDALGEMEQWRQKATTPHYQLDWRWIERYRQLVAYDAYWWWAPAGPFTGEEQQQWEQLYTTHLDESAKEQLGKLTSQSCWREMRAAVAERRQPHLHYPALDIDEVRRRIAGMRALDAEIGQHEPNAIVRRLYHGAIEDETNFLGMIEATYEGNTAQYKELNRRLGFEPTGDEMDEALWRVKRTLQQGLKVKETVEVSQQVIQFLQERLHLTFDLTSEENETIREVPQDGLASTSPSPRTVTAQTAKRFFEAILRDYGYEGWQVLIDSAIDASRVESAARQLFLRDGTFSIEDLRYLFAHEFAGHVTRTSAGERSSLGLLGIGTKGYKAAEEGLALYYEQQATTLEGKTMDDEGTWLGTLATGLASGIATPSQTFLELYAFFENFLLLRRLLRRLDADVETSQKRMRNSALVRCLRTYRGVPDLEQAEVWYGMDVWYLRGLRLIKRAIAEDETVLDRLAVGKIAFEDLPDMQELGIVSAPQSLRTLAYDPALASYVLSFDKPDET